MEKKLKVNAEEGFTRFAAFVVLVALLAYSIYELVYEQDYFNVVYILLILFWLEPHVKRIYKTLFVYTWRSSIKLNNLVKVTSVPLENGLETLVTLHLNNGRIKQYIFRIREQQAEAFIVALNLQENKSATLT